MTAKKSTKTGKNLRGGEGKYFWLARIYTPSNKSRRHGGAGPYWGWTLNVTELSDGSRLWGTETKYVSSELCPIRYLVNYYTFFYTDKVINKNASLLENKKRKAFLVKWMGNVDSLRMRIICLFMLARTSDISPRLLKRKRQDNKWSNFYFKINVIFSNL